MKAAEKRITIELARYLAGAGFHKRTPLLIARAWGEAEAQIRCAVRRDKSSGTLLATLNLGIRFDSVEKLLADTYAEPDSPTIGNSIGYLHENGRYKEWDADKPSTVALMAQDVKAYGIPFFERYSSLDLLLATLEANVRPFDFWMTPEQRIETLAAIFTFRGEKDSALALLDREIASRRGSSRPPDIAIRLRLEKLRARLADFGGDRSHRSLGID
jgi:hypothetical protein